MDGADSILESVAILPLSFSGDFIAALREKLGFYRSLGLPSGGSTPASSVMPAGPAEGS